MNGTGKDRKHPSDTTERKRAEEALKERERYYRTLITSLHEDILVIDRGYRIADVNNTTLKTLGLKREEVIGRHCYQISHGLNAPCHERGQDCGLRNVFDTGESCNLQHDHVNADGESLTTHILMSPMRDEDGNITHVVEAARDVSDLVKAQDVIKEREARFRTLFENIPQRIFLKDLNSAFVTVNEHFAEALRVSSEEIVGKTDHDFFPKELAEKYRADDRRVMESGETMDIEEEHVQDGNTRLVQTVKVPVRDEQGNVTGIFGIFWDITERKRAEEALKASRDYLEELTNSMWDAVFSVRMPERVIEWVNDSFRLLGYEPSECIGKDTAFLYADKDNFLDFGNELEDAMAAGKDVLHAAQLLKRKSGENFPAEITTTFHRENDEVVSVTSIVRDITERKRAEEALRESEERHRAVFEQAAESAVLVDAETGALVDFNDKAHENLGYTHEEFEKLQISDFEVIESPEVVATHIERIVKEGSGVFETKHRTKSGEVRDVHVSSRAISLGGKPFCLSLWLDITERKRAQERLEQSHEQLRALGARLSRTEEAEKRRLARELHDQVGQALTALGMNLNFVRGQLAEDAQGTLAARIEDAIEMVTETTEKIRDVMSELRPAVLDDYGLLAALRWYCERFTVRTGVTVEVLGEEDMARLPLETETGLFRIAQEALTNVAKHARANRAEVRIEETQDGVRLTVSDDGVGFDSAEESGAVERPDWGLMSMAERALAVSGTVHVDSKPGEGTRVVIDVKGDLDGDQDTSG